MEITFRDKKLLVLANDDRKSLQKLGKVRSERFKTRLIQLQSAQTLEEVRNLPGNYHELAGNRKGQWSCDLDQPYRLIFEPHEDPVPTDDKGRYIWLEIKGIEVIEIIDYH